MIFSKDFKIMRRLVNIILVFHHSQQISNLHRCAYKGNLLGFRFRNCRLSDADVFVARCKNQQQQSKHKQVSKIGKNYLLPSVEPALFAEAKQPIDTTRR